MEQWIAENRFLVVTFVGAFVVVGIMAVVAALLKRNRDEGLKQKVAPANRPIFVGGLPGEISWWNTPPTNGIPPQDYTSIKLSRRVANKKAFERVWAWLVYLFHIENTDELVPMLSGRMGKEEELVTRFLDDETKDRVLELHQLSYRNRIGFGAEDDALSFSVKMMIKKPEDLEEFTKTIEIILDIFDRAEKTF